MIIAVLALLIYGILVLTTRTSQNRLYLKFIFICYPFLGIDLLPSVLTISVFDLLTLVFFIFLHERPERFKNLFSNYSLFAFLLFGTMFTGIALSDDINRYTISATIQFFTSILFAIFLMNELHASDSFMKWMIGGITGIFLFSLLFLGFQFLIGPSFSFAKSPNINVDGGLSNRYPSFFQDPQKYAQFLSMCILMMFSGKYIKKSYSTFWILLIAITGFVAILFTGGRAALGGFTAGLFLILLFSDLKIKWVFILIAIPVIFLVVEYQEYIPLLNRASVDESFDFRIQIWKEAWQTFLDHPIFGIGIGNYANYVSQHYPHQFWMNDNDITYYDHPESGYLKVLVEFGIMGMLLFSIYFLTPIFNAVQTIYRNSDNVSLYFLAALVSWLISFQTVYSLGDIRIKILVIIGLISLQFRTSQFIAK